MGTLAPLSQISLAHAFTLRVSFLFVFQPRPPHAGAKDRGTIADTFARLRKTKEFAGVYGRLGDLGTNETNELISTNSRSSRDE
jgi:hypothetical protein